MFFWNSLAFSMIQQMLTIWSLVPMPLQNATCTFGISEFTYCWSLAWRSLSTELKWKSLSHAPTGCSPWGSSVRGILQARILEWVTISFSRGSSQPRDQTQFSCITGRFFTIWATKKALISISLRSVSEILSYSFIWNVFLCPLTLPDSMFFLHGLGETVPSPSWRNGLV